MERMSEERENELVKQAQGGSTKAFGELEKQYHWLVYKVARRILSRGAEHFAEYAEDAAQNAFEYAFVHIKEYKPGRFYRWLWSVTRVAAFRMRDDLAHQDYHEAEFDDRLVVLDNDLESIDFEQNSWIEAVENIEAYIRRAGGLIIPGRQLDDLVMRAQGYSPAEIAKTTGRAPDTVRKSIWRARKQFAVLVHKR